MVFGGILIGGAATGILSGAVLSQSGNLVNVWMNTRTLVKLHALLPEGADEFLREHREGTRDSLTT